MPPKPPSNQGADAMQKRFAAEKGASSVPSQSGQSDDQARRLEDAIKERAANSDKPAEYFAR